MQSSGLYFLAVALVYLAGIAFASANIRSGFFLKAFNQIKNPPEKSVCITFDDGPDEINTPAVLTILEEFGCKAAFFIIGSKINGREAILKRMDEAGHLIGNHSYSHSNLFPAKTTKAVISELEKTSEAIAGVIGKYPQTFRPPFGVTHHFGWRC